jgi:hypothetical protein
MAHSSIESTFQSLPPEIRNEIYGYLFGKQCRLKLIYKGHRIIYAIKQADQSEAHESTSTFESLFGYYVGLRRHAAILRTCRQIYQEAASILYGSTVFSFSKIVDVMWIKPGYEPCSFPTQCLQHVQKLKVYVDYDEPQYTSWRAERIGYLIKEAGALRELRLSFHIGQLWATGDDIDTWTQIMLYKSGIFEVLKASRSLRKVHVRVSNTRDLDVARYFERLVHAITTTEDWSCEHDHEPLVKAKDRVDEDGNLWKDDEYGHKWTWDLRSVPSEATK